MRTDIMEHRLCPMQYNMHLLSTDHSVMQQVLHRLLVTERATRWISITEEKE